MRVVLVATDGSECGTAALKQAAELASAHGARLVVLTVTPRALAPQSMSPEIREYARAEHLAGDEPGALSLMAEDILAEAKAIVAGRHGVDATYISRAGDPADEILACARERSADVILLGSRGRGALGAFLLGSVSRSVTNAAGCSVMIVPLDE